GPASLAHEPEEARPHVHGLRRHGNPSRREGARVLPPLPPELAADRAAQGRQARQDDPAPGHRGEGPLADREGPDRGVREVLLAPLRFAAERSSMDADRIPLAEEFLREAVFASRGAQAAIGALRARRPSGGGSCGLGDEAEFVLDLSSRAREIYARLF